MKLTARQVPNFFAKHSWKSYPVLVLYGHAGDSIREHIAQLLHSAEVDKKDAFQYLRLYGNDLQSDSKRLSYEASSSSLTQQDRWIVVQGKNSEIEPALKGLYAPEMAERFGNNRIIIHLEDVAAKAAILRHCGDCAWIMTIPCYETDSDTIEQFITSYCTAKGWTCDYATKDLLLNLAEGNLDTIRHITDKITLYGVTENRLDSNIVLICTGEDQQQNLQELTLTVFSHQAQQADAILRRLLEQKITPIAICRSLSQHCSKILRLKSLAQTSSLDMAMKQHQPPIFFKQIPEIKRQCQRWSNPQLALCSELLLQQEIQMKSTAFHDVILLQQLILKLSK